MINSTPSPYLPFTTAFVLSTLIIICLIDKWAPEWASQNLHLEMKKIVY